MIQLNLNRQNLKLIGGIIMRMMIPDEGGIPPYEDPINIIVVG